MATSPEPFGESPTTKAPVPVGTCNINIAFDGDVIFALQQTRLRVSSAILFSASPVFKRMFGPNFAEGQGERSSKNPRKITLSDDDVSAMTKLCRILHHQSETRDTLLTQDTDHTPAETIGRCIDDLFALTVVSDKYDCSDSVEAVVKYLLSEYASPSLCERMSARATLVLSAIAYKIYDCRHFALFTRRLVLDFGVSYSNLAGNYALEELPYMFLLLLEEQRKCAWTEFRDKLPKLADKRCWDESCTAVGTGVNFPAAVVDYTVSGTPDEKRWPPQDTMFSNLREYLEIVLRRGDVTVEFSYHCCHLQSNQITVKGGELRSLCCDVSRIARGLCLTCLEKQSTFGGRCEHGDLLDGWVYNDPIR